VATTSFREPLPEQPNLDQLRKRARELQRAVRRGTPEALEFSGLTGPDPAFALSSAQRTIAPLAWAEHFGYARLAALLTAAPRPGRPG
jgi:hypothetical protein